MMEIVTIIRLYITWTISTSLWTSVEEYLDKIVCYNGLGCFPTSFLSWHHRQPSTPAEINTTFTLFTPETMGTTGESLTIETSRQKWLNSSSFDSMRNTTMYIHGFQDNRFNEYSLKMQHILLNTLNVNVIMVDWSDAADNIDYDQARADTRVVGVQVARLIERLIDETGVSYESIHLIGHSLGAHTAGYTGEALSGMVGRITGLDPAGPEFGGSLTSAECRLDPTDAMFVDVIHTDGEIIVAGGFGLMDELGHQDFYPNGGESQPGCVINPVCDHMRALDLFFESITNSPTTKFTSMRTAIDWHRMEEGDYLQCNQTVSCPTMGYWAEKRKGEGVYYLETKDSPPYSLS
nr:pancreatic lipase-related protein 2-like isoform X1 [Lytechinus pictus]